MPLTTEGAAALVNGQATKAPRVQRVRVTRPFYDRGEVRGAGSILDFPLHLAVELRHAGKVEFVAPDAKLHTTDHVPPRIDGSLRG